MVNVEQYFDRLEADNQELKETMKQVIIKGAEM